MGLILARLFIQATKRLFEILKVTDKIKIVVTDGTSNMVKAFSLPGYAKSYSIDLRKRKVMRKT